MKLVIPDSAPQPVYFKAICSALRLPVGFKMNPGQSVQFDDRICAIGRGVEGTKAYYGYGHPDFDPYKNDYPTESESRVIRLTYGYDPACQETPFLPDTTACSMEIRGLTSHSGLINGNLTDYHYDYGTITLKLNRTESFCSDTNVLTAVSGEAFYKKGSYSSTLDNLCHSGVGDSTNTCLSERANPDASPANNDDCMGPSANRTRFFSN